MIGETVTRQRAGTATDGYGDTVPDWSTPSTLDIEGCALSPTTPVEDLRDGRQAIVAEPTLYAPPGADILATDRIVARGDTYEVDGEPAAWRDPYSGRPVGLQARLRSVSG